MGAITRIDNPVTLRERVDRGDIVFNYGLQVVYRNQGNIVKPANVATQMQPIGNGPQPQTPERARRRRRYFGAWSVTPDVWFKLHYKALTIEFEGIGVFGKHRSGRASWRPTNEPLTLRQLGWVAASELRLYREALFVGLETGGATGDQAEAPGQYLNYRWQLRPAADGRPLAQRLPFLARLPRRPDLLPPHPRARSPTPIYIKPQAAYWFDLGRTRALGLNGAFIYSMAQVPVSTPGQRR